MLIFCMSICVYLLIGNFLTWACGIPNEVLRREPHVSFVSAYIASVIVIPIIAVMVAMAMIVQAWRKHNGGNTAV